MDLEKLATSAVMTELSKTDRLSGFINSGDKEPCWDGNIYIHEGKNYTKKNIKKVATQVKGKAVKAGNIKETIKYPVSQIDLNAYMMNGGTMFFVVYLDKETGNTIQIYYAQLLPLKIMTLLKDAKKIYQVVFQRFPTDNFKKTELLLNYHVNAQRQASFVGKELPTIDELRKQDLLESLSFHYTTFGKNVSYCDLPKRLDGNPITMYANIKGGSAQIPVEHYEKISKVQISNDNELPVSVDGTIYYDGYRVIMTADEIELHIGSCVRIIFPNTDKREIPVSVTIKVKILGTLKEQIKGLEFVSAMIKHGSFCIGEHEFPSDFPEEELEKISAAEFEDILSGYKQIQELLNLMNVKKDLDIQKCEDEEYRKLNLLISTIKERRPIKDSPKDVAEVQKITIANLNLAIVYIKNENGKCYLWDYFANHFNVLCRVEGKEDMRVSQFSTMKAEDFLLYDNLNLQTVVDDHRKIPPNDLLYEFGNDTMLEMLKAYDENFSQELLDAAKQMAEWLKLQSEYSKEDIMTINELQIVLRERNLTFAEKSKLYAIIEKTTEDYLKAGALLLLDEQSEAKILFDTFSEEQMDRFKLFPIYKFYKDMDTNVDGKASSDNNVNYED